MDGTNSDDLNDYRPGFKVLKELQILSSLLENRLTKKDIRKFSKELNLQTWVNPVG